MNKKLLNRNLKRLQHKDKKVCNYCLGIYGKLSKCDKCKDLFCKSCMIVLNKNKKYCVACLINYVKKDVVLIVEK